VWIRLRRSSGAKAADQAQPFTKASHIRRGRGDLFALIAPSSNGSTHSPATLLPGRAAQCRAVATAQQSAPPSEARETIVDPESDFMIDVLREAAIRHVALTPGSTFRGLQEPPINGARHRHSQSFWSA
jgi:hypothetical protein